MSAGSEAVKKWRRNAKARLIRAFGGKCGICGYNKCDEVMEFHHLDPTTKETTWSQIRGSIKGWNTIVDEMSKCVMLCSNCHKEVHAGVAVVPDDVARLNKEAADYKTSERHVYHDQCPVCGKEKLKSTRTCSQKCAASRRFRVDWTAVDIDDLLRVHKTYSAVGELLGVTGAAVKRKQRQLIEGKW